MSEIEFHKLLNSQRSECKTKRIALYFGAVSGALTLFFTLGSLPFILPFFRRFCLPYVPATNQQVSNVMEALKGRSGNLVDLGSGDGRIVLRAAREGFESTGIELNPWLVLYSKFSSLYSGLYKITRFYRQDLWTFNLRPYKNVVIFGIDSMMLDLEKKFNNELTCGTHIVACRFPLPNMTPDKIIGFGFDKVWVYVLR